MNKKISFNKFNEFFALFSLFLIEFAIYTKNVTYITQYSQKIINISLVILFILSVFKLTIIKINKQKWILFICLTLFSLTNYFITSDSIILQLCFLIIAFYNLNFKDIVKKNMIFKLILLLFILINYYTNNVITNYFTRNGIIRYSYGFNQPNVFGVYIVSLFIDYIYLNFKAKKIFIKNILFIIVLFFINLAKSRASELILILFYIAYLLYIISVKFNLNSKIASKIKIPKAKKIYLCIFAIFLLITLFSFISTSDYVLGKNYALKLDKLFSERLYIQSIFTKLYKITLFGNEIDYFDTLDNAYIRLMLNYGFICWIIYYFIYSTIYFKAKKNNNKIIIIIVLIFLLYGLMEWYILRPGLNIFLLYFSSKDDNLNRSSEQNEK